MMHRNYLSGLLATLLSLGAWSDGQAAEPRAKEPSLSQLSLEIAALQTIHRLKLTPQQITALRRAAADSAPKGEQQNGGKGSERVRAALIDLRGALLKGDDEKIDEFEEKLGDLLDNEEAELDDAVILTTAGRKRAGEFLHLLSPRQTAAFLAAGEELPDPLERLVEALDVAAKANEADWKEVSESIAEDLGWQLGGLEAERVQMIESKVKDYLKKVRSTKDLEKHRPELEKGARQIVNLVTPTFVLHNFVEHALAELLSNPRLAAALDAYPNK